MSIEELKRPSRIDEDRIQKLKELFPEAFFGGVLNLERLKEEINGIGEEAAEANAEESYGLQWAGKREARKLAFLPAEGTLNLIKGEGIAEECSNNFFLEGDNLEILRILQKSYRQRIKLIYIDPPYNTGNDFVYKDDFKEPLKSYLLKSGQADEEGLLTSNPRVGGRFHAKWLSMMYPRIRLARNLLSREGVIFISIDNNELANLILLMNDIFGEENFIGTIAIQSNPRGRHLEKHIATSHENIVVYAKDFDRAVINKSPLTEEQKKEYNLEDQQGRYRLLGLRKRGSFSKREERPNLYYPVYYSPEKADLTLEKIPGYVEIIPRLSDGTDGVWRWGKEKFVQDKSQLIAREISARGEWDVFQKDYLSEDSARKYKTLWFDKDVNYENGKREIRELFGGDVPFDTPKPVNLIKRIIQMGMGKDGIVLDFFAGSGTTAQAVLELNKEDNGGRHFILVQIPEPVEHKEFDDIADICKERIRKVILALQEKDPNSGQDRGFVVYRLQKSNIPKWNNTAFDNVNLLQEKLDIFTNTRFIESWDSQNIVIELMLNQGFPLDSEISIKEREGNTIWTVRHLDMPFQMHICLDEKLSESTVAMIAANFRNDTFICLDDALSDRDKVILSESMKVKTI